MGSDTINSESKDCATSYDDGYNKGYNSGFNKGYDAGYDSGKRAGYLEGAAEDIDFHGEQLVASLLPENVILPQYSVNEVLQCGIKNLKEDWIYLLSAKEVADQLHGALDRQEGFSVVRLGDGEALLLAHDTVISSSEAKKRAPWLAYAGVQLPNPQAREALCEAVKNANVIGVPTPRVANHQPMLFSAFNKLGVEWEKKQLTHAVINYILHIEGFLRNIVQHRKVIVVGNKARPTAKILRKAGVNITGTVSPVQGVADVDHVLERARRLDFDIALVPAGIAAVMISQRISYELGKVAIDFGHLADELISGHKTW